MKRTVILHTFEDVVNVLDPSGAFPLLCRLVICELDERPHLLFFCGAFQSDSANADRPSWRDDSRVQLLSPGSIVSANVVPSPGARLDLEVLTPQFMNAEAPVLRISLSRSAHSVTTDSAWGDACIAFTRAYRSDAPRSLPAPAPENSGSTGGGGMKIAAALPRDNSGQSSFSAVSQVWGRPQVAPPLRIGVPANATLRQVESLPVMSAEESLSPAMSLEQPRQQHRGPAQPGASAHNARISTGSDRYATSSPLAHDAAAAVATSKPTPPESYTRPTPPESLNRSRRGDSSLTDESFGSGYYEDVPSALPSSSAGVAPSLGPTSNSSSPGDQHSYRQALLRSIATAALSPQHGLDTGGGGVGSSTRMLLSPDMPPPPDEAKRRGLSGAAGPIAAVSPVSASSAAAATVPDDASAAAGSSAAGDAAGAAVAVSFDASARPLAVDVTRDVTVLPRTPPLAAAVHSADPSAASSQDTTSAAAISAAHAPAVSSGAPSDAPSGSRGGATAAAGDVAVAEASGGDPPSPAIVARRGNARERDREEAADVADSIMKLLSMTTTTREARQGMSRREYRRMLLQQHHAQTGVPFSARGGRPPLSPHAGGAAAGGSAYDEEGLRGASSGSGSGSSASGGSAPSANFNFGSGGPAAVRAPTDSRRSPSGTPSDAMQHQAVTPAAAAGPVTPPSPLSSHDARAGDNSVANTLAAAALRLSEQQRTRSGAGSSEQHAESSVASQSRRPQPGARMGGRGNQHGAAAGGGGSVSTEVSATHPPVPVLAITQATSHWGQQQQQHRSLQQHLLPDILSLTGVGDDTEREQHVLLGMPSSRQQQQQQQQMYLSQQRHPHFSQQQQQEHTSTGFPASSESASAPAFGADFQQQHHLQQSYYGVSEADHPKSSSTSRYTGLSLLSRDNFNYSGGVVGAAAPSSTGHQGSARFFPPLVSPLYLHAGAADASGGGGGADTLTLREEARGSSSSSSSGTFASHRQGTSSLPSSSLRISNSGSSGSASSSGGGGITGQQRGEALDDRGGSFAASSRGSFPTHASLDDDMTVRTAASSFAMPLSLGGSPPFLLPATNRSSSSSLPPSGPIDTATQRYASSPNSSSYTGRTQQQQQSQSQLEISGASASSPLVAGVQYYGGGGAVSHQHHQQQQQRVVDQGEEHGWQQQQTYQHLGAYSSHTSGTGGESAIGGPQQQPWGYSSRQLHALPAATAPAYVTLSGISEDHVYTDSSSGVPAGDGPYCGSSGGGGGSARDGSGATHSMGGRSGGGQFDTTHGPFSVRESSSAGVGGRQYGGGQRDHSHYYYGGGSGGGGHTNFNLSGSGGHFTSTSGGGGYPSQSAYQPLQQQQPPLPSFPPPPLGQQQLQQVHAAAACIPSSDVSQQQQLLLQQLLSAPTTGSAGTFGGTQQQQMMMRHNETAQWQGHESQMQQQHGWPAQQQQQQQQSVALDDGPTAVAERGRAPVGGSSTFIPSLQQSAWSSAPVTQPWQQQQQDERDHTAKPQQLHPEYEQQQPYSVPRNPGPGGNASVSGSLSDQECCIM